MRTSISIALIFIASQAASTVAGQEAPARAPQVLLVTAHPDDDAAFAGAVYQITHKLRGAVDLALVTDGSGGFRYATLAEPIYHLDLTDEAIARQFLPTIRKRELMAGGAIIGIRKYFFFDQLDDGVTNDPEPALTRIWNATFVRERLAELMRGTSYDLVIGLLPTPEMHGHHKAATILAIEAARAISPERRPVVLGGFACAFGGGPIRFDGLDGYPITRVTGGEPLVRFDRRQPLGHEGRLDFQIIANWVIAEHKSQGLMQTRMNLLEEECYWYFDSNPTESRARVVEWFERLRVDSR